MTNEINLKQPKRYVLRFTFEPKHKLMLFDCTNAEIEKAVSEAEFLARVLECELVTDELVNTLRAVMFGCCAYLADALGTHLPDPQMIRDIYPYARLVKAEVFSASFENFVAEMRQDAPELYERMVNCNGKN